MESSKFSLAKEVGGYTTHNLSDNKIFFASKKKIKLSFSLQQISIVNSSEIMKLKLFSNLICRIMKYMDHESMQPALVIDIVDEEKKEIVAKAAKIFYNAAGVGGFMFSHGYITQWEIVPFDRICRSFMLGDKTAFLLDIKEFNLRVSQEADWYIKNNLE